MFKDLQRRLQRDAKKTVDARVHASSMRHRSAASTNPGAYAKELVRTCEDIVLDTNNVSVTNHVELLCSSRGKYWRADRKMRWSCDNTTGTRFFFFQNVICDMFSRVVVNFFIIGRGCSSTIAQVPDLFVELGFSFGDVEVLVLVLWLAMPATIVSATFPITSFGGIPA
ncbi:hypothetical protein Tco_1202517 [Tanacetum coccineum]